MCHIWPKSLCLISRNWGSNDKILSVQVKNWVSLEKRNGSQILIPNPSSMLEPLKYGTLIGQVQERGGSQPTHRAVASVMKSFSWDPSLTSIEMLDTVCPPGATRRLEG